MAEAHDALDSSARARSALPARRQHLAPRPTGRVELNLNDIGRIELRTTTPLFYDEYFRSRSTGSFILVDDATNVTVGAGMLLKPQP